MIAPSARNATVTGLAINARADAAGNVVCLVNADADPANDDPTCVPWNIWQPGGVNQESLGYLQTPGFQRASARQEIMHADVTADFGNRVKLPSAETGLVLNVAFNYGGRQEIVRAVQRILRTGTPVEDITEELIDQHLDTAGLPDLDLVIRTGGEMRLSNFLLWQAAYAEYYSTPICWPDFGREELFQAFAEFGRRARRFGGLS